MVVNRVKLWNTTHTLDVRRIFGMAKFTRDLYLFVFYRVSWKFISSHCFVWFCVFFYFYFCVGFFFFPSFVWLIYVGICPDTVLYAKSLVRKKFGKFEKYARIFCHSLIKLFTCLVLIYFILCVRGAALRALLCELAELKRLFVGRLIFLYAFYLFFYIIRQVNHKESIVWAISHPCAKEKPFASQSN